jgi:hypothetical protein
MNSNTPGPRAPTDQRGPDVLGSSVAPTRKHRFIKLLLLLFITVQADLQAHHGRDFIFIQDSAIPAPFNGVVLAGFEWSREGDDSEFSSEPGFYMGLTPALAFGLTAGFSDEGDGWNSSGFTPQLVVSLLPATGPMNFRMGLWTGYEFANDVGTSFRGTVQKPTKTDPDDDDDPGIDPLHTGGPEPIPGTGMDYHDSRGGIHRHGESGWYSRFIMEADLSHHTRVVFNLVSFVSGNSGRPGFGYATGIRHEFNHDLSLGLEAIGDFRSRGSSHQLLATTMIGLPGHLSLRLGFGGGLTEASPDFTLHSSLMWRF